MGTPPPLPLPVLPHGSISAPDGGAGTEQAPDLGKRDDGGEASETAVLADLASKIASGVNAAAADWSFTSPTTGTNFTPTENSQYIVTVKGAGGGSGGAGSDTNVNHAGAAGGEGGSAVVTMELKAGLTYSVKVGGGGTAGGTANASATNGGGATGSGGKLTGGGGGGYSALYYGDTALVVAGGGGGGASGDYILGAGGAGGNTGAGTTGGGATSSYANESAYGGQGGQAGAAGAGGATSGAVTTSAKTTTGSWKCYGSAGNAGSGMTGGQSRSLEGTSGYWIHSGAGGGGYFGGGSGAVTGSFLGGSNFTGTTRGAGGGGGSGYVNTATNQSYFAYKGNSSSTTNGGGGAGGAAIAMSSATVGTVAVTGNKGGDGSVEIEISNPVTVTYNANGGTVGKASAKLTSGYSTALPTPTRSNYDFAGWYTAASGGSSVGTAGASYAPTASVQLYAHWTLSTYKVTYTKADCSAAGAESDTVSVGSQFTARSAGVDTPEGYTLYGWAKSSSTGARDYVPGTKYTPSSDLTLYPIYTRSISYDVNYEDGASPTASTQSYYGNQARAITLAGPSGRCLARRAGRASPQAAGPPGGAGAVQGGCRGASGRGPAWR